MKHLGKACLAGLTLLGATMVGAQVPDPYQAAASATGLKPLAPVMMAGSDAVAASFQTGILPKITSMLNVRLSETKALTGIDSLKLDPSKLFLNTLSTVRAYFVGEGAGYHNSVGLTVSGSAGTTTMSGLVFADASSTVSTYQPATKAVRTSTDPLLPGDFVDLGTFAARSTLDFFLIANGAQGGTTRYYADATRNPDRINHVVTFALPDSPYLILSYEDMLGGGDMDYNDTIIALDIGRANIAHMIGAPEPGLAFTLAGFLAVAGLGLRRPRSSVQ